MTRKTLAALGLIGASAAAASAQQQPDAPAPPAVAPVAPVAPPPAAIPEPLPPAAARVAPAAPPVGVPQREVIRWPGGWMYLDGPEVIVRHGSTTTTSGRSSTVVSGAANGFGNSIVVDNGGSPGVTVIRNSRNGVGNSITVTPDGPVFEAPHRPQFGERRVLADPAMIPPAVEDAAAFAEAPRYKGRANDFWTRRAWSDRYDCNVYWSDAQRRWYRYHGDDDTYRPLPTDFDPTGDRQP